MGRRADGRRTGGKADVGQRRGERADGGWMGGWADGRIARRMEADGRTSGQADESGRGADRVD